ncbi:MAG: ATP-binding cassette domain-containing protein [Malacoplasma sp.]|nr:ATP-binding cassette domain-containing protein [Malacoplasma sp.]
MQNSQIIGKDQNCKKSILTVNNLRCVFNEKEENEIVAIDNFSYEFESNKIHFIIGNSGSGKSTLVSHFNGLIKSKVGNITVDNFEIKEGKKKIKKPKILRRIVSMVFQFPEYQLFKSTVEKDVSFGPNALGLPKEKSVKFNLESLKKEVNQDFDFIESKFRKKLKNKFIDLNKDDFFDLVVKKYKIAVKKNIAKVIFEYKRKSFTKKYNLETKTPDDIAHEDAVFYLNKMGIDESFLDRSPFGLSGGQKRRVAIAGILAIEPKILIFDEPTAGLDPQGEQEMLEVILDAKKSGKTVFVITHTMDHVLEIGDNVVVMDQGKILMDGNPYDVFTNKDLYLKTKMEKPKIIDIIDSLVEKKKIFNHLYDMKPKTAEELAEAIGKILNERR